MITKKALQQVLDGAQKEEDEGPCFCTDEDCEYWHDDDGSVPASHVVTFVKPDGSLDTAENKAYLGPAWGLDCDLETVLEHPQTWPEDAPRMVIVERATGQWRPATDYL